MWLMTTRGFYSAVQHRDEPTKVLVRARCEEDIRNLADLIDAEPYPLSRSDYEWRLECQLAEWTKAVALMTMEIDYPNFKNAVKKKQGQKRADIYMRVWSALLSLEPKRKSKWWRKDEDVEADDEDVEFDGKGNALCPECGGVCDEELSGLWVCRSVECPDYLNVVAG